MTTTTQKRKVCFVITSKIHYARNKQILVALKEHQGIELQIIVGGSALLEKYGNVEPDILADGFAIDARFLMSLEGGTLTAMAKSAGVGLLELPDIFERLAPDVVIIRGDRYEMLPVAIAAAYMNIPIAHIEGGDVTGTIDESVRHAITKLAHIHFPTSEDSRRRIIQMGELEQYVFNFGSPEIELVSLTNYVISDELINTLGVGSTVGINGLFIMVLQHPVTSEVQDARAQIEETLHAVNDAKIPTIWFWPNADAGTDDVSKGIRAFREKYAPEHIHFLTYRLQSDQFYALLKKSACLVGNSSSGLKEAGFLGIPVVNIGTRQGGRYYGTNVVSVDNERKVIQQSILTQIEHGSYESDHHLYKEGTSMRIAEVLSSVPLYIQKQFSDNVQQQ